MSFTGTCFACALPCLRIHRVFITVYNVLISHPPMRYYRMSYRISLQVVQDDAIEAARSAHKVAMASPTPSIAPPLPMTPPSLSLQSLPPGEQASSFPPLPSSPSSMPVGPAGAAAAARAAHAASLAAHGPGLEKAAQDAVRTLWFGSGWKGFGNKGSTSIGSTIGSEKSGANASSGSAAAAAAAHLLFLAGQLMLEECTMAADLNNHDLYHQGKCINTVCRLSLLVFLRCDRDS